MRKRTEHGFVALRLEGGILPAEFFQKVAALTAKKQKNADYRLAKGLNIRDEIGRAWRIAVAEWQEYQEHRIRTDADQNEIGIKRWLTSLFKQVLGFEDLTASDRIYHAERSFPINYRSENGIVPMVFATADYQLDKGHVLFGEDGRKRSPHGLLQEYLNADESCLWGLVSNGLKVRLLRDNPSLSRPAFIEADLQRIFEEELFADFAAMWLIFHASRFGATDGNPEHCALEDWREEAQVVGERALTDLRKGVTQALRELGNGFVQFPSNTELRTAFQDGSFTPMEMYQELLRLVYRFIFLFTAEDRDILNTPDGNDSAKVLYQDGYSITRLRELALKRHNYDSFPDLWEGLQVVFTGLSQGAEALRLPALGGLFAGEQCPWIDSALIDNNRLLKAIYNLSFFRTGEVLARINYHDMDTEELGSVYESLLELHPQVNVTNMPWSFSFAGDDTGEGVSGSERKLSGSYYTPDCLVQELIKSALEPVISKTITENPTDPAGALLKLKIIDPACGSGHFLLAASRRMAAELARLEADTNQPDEALYRHCMRLVVQKCIYGVDLNPMAVELCKTALWLETIEPGMPLGFLDSHIRCGNSLVGIRDLKILDDGIPDEAYKSFFGDDKEIAASLKKDNKMSRRGQQGLFANGQHVPMTLDITFDELPEETAFDIARKKAAWKETIKTAKAERLACDIWTGAFFAPKTLTGREMVPLTDDVERARSNISIRPVIAEAVQYLSEQNRFFHWPLEFPTVFLNGGFNLVLGNPPWERTKLKEEDFFATRSSEIANASNKSERQKLIDKLADISASPSDKNLYTEFTNAKRSADAIGEFIRSSNQSPLTGIGDLNLYPLFCELALNIIRDKGFLGLVVKTGIATDDGNKLFFQKLIENDWLKYLYSFVEIRKIFKGAKSPDPFCLITITKQPVDAELAVGMYSVSEINDSRKRFKLNNNIVSLINPNTKTCPMFVSNEDAIIINKIYTNSGALINEMENRNDWNISFYRMFDMSNDSHLFLSYEQLKANDCTINNSKWMDATGKMYYPLYEAKLIHQYDNRWATFEVGADSAHNSSLEEKIDLSYEPLPRNWVIEDEFDSWIKSNSIADSYFICWRNNARVVAQRTFISTFLPMYPAGNSLTMLVFNDKTSAKYKSALLGSFNSLVVDYVARQKMAGPNLNFFFVKQFPILPPSKYSEKDLDFISIRVLELVFTSESMRAFADDMGFTGNPFSWNPERRLLLRAELDAYYAILYGLTRDELRYILDPSDVYGEDYPSETFRVLKNCEIEEFGEYRTQRLVLESYDNIVAATKLLSTGIQASQVVNVAYPSTAWDTAVCAFTLALVGKQEMDIDSMVTAFILGSNPDLCMKFLPATEHASFQAMRKTSPQELFITSRPTLNYGSLTNYLSSLGAITVINKRLCPGAELAKTQASLSANAFDGLATAVLQAVTAINTKPASDSVLVEFQQERKSWLKMVA